MVKKIHSVKEKAKINKDAAAARHKNYCNMAGSEIARLHPLKMAEAIECLKAEIANLQPNKKPAPKKAKTKK